MTYRPIESRKTTTVVVLLLLYPLDLGEYVHQRTIVWLMCIHDINEHVLEVPSRAAMHAVPP